MFKRFLVPVVAVPVALAVAGCGGDNNSSPSASAMPPVKNGGEVLHVTANPSGELEFSPMSLTAQAGEVTIEMKNPSSSGLEHGIAIEGNGVDKDGPIVSPGGTSVVTANLDPGTYEFYCPFDHHAQDGMTGTLTVR